MRILLLFFSIEDYLLRQYWLGSSVGRAGD